MSRPRRSGRARRRGLLSAAAAALVACSGDAGGGPARAGDLLGGTGAPAGIEGRVTIGPLCPVERFPPDPACQPTAETFAPVKVLILDPAGAVLRRVDLDDQGRYAVSLEPGTYLVDTTWRGIGEGGGDPAPGDSGSVGGGTGIGEPGDDGVVGAPDDPPPPAVIDSSGSGVVPPDPGGSDPGGAPGIPVPPDSADPGVPDPHEPPEPCDPVWPTEPADPGGIVPLEEPAIVDSTGCGAPGFPGDPGEPVPPDTVFPEPPAPGDTTAPPPVPLPFPGDSLAEGPADGEAVPQHLLPVEVELEAGETARLDIDIDTGIR